MGVLQATPLLLLTLHLTNAAAADVSAPSLLAASSKCGDTFYTKSGSFSSYTYASSKTTLPCEWRISSDPDQRILLNVTDLNIVKDRDCSRGYIEVRDGYFYSSPLLGDGSYCGMGPLDPILSNGNKLLISYLDKIGGQGFEATYESVCGEDFYLMGRNNFVTPKFPQQYPLSTKCIWRVTVPDNYQVRLQFTSFDVEKENGCLFDYVEVRDGFKLNSKLIGTYCNGRLPPQSIISSGTSLTIKFESDSSVANRGFNATIVSLFDYCSNTNHGCAQVCINGEYGYTCDCYPGYQLHSNNKSCELICGGNLYGSSGVVRSPSYPALYPLNRNCVWNIETLYESRMSLRFTQFDLENGFVNGTNTVCFKDFVKISSISLSNPFTVPSGYCTDGSFFDITRVHGYYCGNKIPGPFKSDKNKFSVIFNSDSSVQRYGFSFSYAAELQECSVNNKNCFHGCYSLSNGQGECSCLANYIRQPNKRDCFNNNGCIFEISSTSGTFNSPNYPNSYPNSKNCVWKFRTTPGHKLLIDFNSFQLEGGSTTCAKDNLIVYDGPSSASSVLGRFCGSTKPIQTRSSSNELYVTFKSDSSVVFKGFHANYSSTCGGNYVAGPESKYIYSHANYGYGPYSDRASCEWFIQGSQGKTLTVSFLSFFLENGYDYVRIWKKDNNGVLTSYGSYTGNVKPPRICIQNDSILIQFTTDSSVNKEGFSFVYKST